MEVVRAQQRELPSRQELVTAAIGRLQAEYASPESVAQRRDITKGLFTRARRLTSDVTSRITGRVPLQDDSKQTLTNMATKAIDTALKGPEQALQGPVGFAERNYSRVAQIISNGVTNKNPLAETAATSLLNLWEREQKGEKVAVLTQTDPLVLKEMGIAFAAILTAFKAESSIKARKLDTNIDLAEVVTAATTAVAGTVGRIFISEMIRGVGEYLAAYRNVAKPEEMLERFTRIAEKRVKSTNTN